MVFFLVIRSLTFPCLSVLAQWYLYLDPKGALSLCPLVWPVRNKMPALWMLVQQNLVPLTFIVVVSVEAAILIGLINVCLPKIVGQFVNRIVLFFLRPFVSIMRWRFLQEVVLHFFTFSVCAQSRRKMGSQTFSAQAFGFVGALLLAASSMYSFFLHVPRTISKQWIYFLFAMSLFGMLAPFSLSQESQIYGCLAVAIGHAVVTWLFTKAGFGGSGWKGSLCSGALASMGVFATLVLVRSSSDHENLEPLALGGVLLGHIAYFLSLLLLTSKWIAPSDDYWNLQCIMGMSLSIVLLIGKNFDIAAFNNTSNVVLIIWLMLKEMELKIDSIGVKVLAVYMLYLFLDKESVAAMFDPRGLYVGNPVTNSSMSSV